MRDLSQSSAPSIVTFEADFTFATASPVDFGSLAAGDVIIDVDVLVETIFDDPSSILTVGQVSDPGNILASTDIDPINLGTYNNGACYQVSGSDAIRLQVVPGTSSQGAGKVIVTIRKV